MKFTTLKVSPKMENGITIAVKGELVQVADWVKKACNEDEIGDEIDSFFDGYGDLVRGDDGKLYMATEMYCGGNHGYGIWCEVEDQNLKF